MTDLKVQDQHIASRPRPISRADRAPLCITLHLGEPSLALGHRCKTGIPASPKTLRQRIQAWSP